MQTCRDFCSDSHKYYYSSISIATNCIFLLPQVFVYHMQHRVGEINDERFRKYLLNFNQIKTTCTYIVNIAHEVPEVSMLEVIGSKRCSTKLLYLYN